MASAPIRAVDGAAAKRLTGSRPGPLSAFVAAAIVGIGCAAATYKLLRSGN